jgi:hypothetical protein
MGVVKDDRYCADTAHAVQRVKSCHFLHVIPQSGAIARKRLKQPMGVRSRHYLRQYDSAGMVLCKGAGSSSTAWEFMDSEQPQPPMLWSMRPASPRFKPGWVTPISARQRSTIGERAGLKIHRPTR